MSKSIASFFTKLDAAASYQTQQNYLDRLSADEIEKQSGEKRKREENKPGPGRPKKLTVVELQPSSDAAVSNTDKGDTKYINWFDSPLIADIIEAVQLNRRAFVAVRELQKKFPRQIVNIEEDFGKQLEDEDEQEKETRWDEQSSDEEKDVLDIMREIHHGTRRSTRVRKERDFLHAHMLIPSNQIHIEPFEK